MMLLGMMIPMIMTVIVSALVMAIVPAMRMPTTARMCLMMTMPTPMQMLRVMLLLRVI